MKKQHGECIKHFEDATGVLEKMMKEMYENSSEQYRNILNRGLFLLLCAEFQNTLRQILLEVIESIEKSAESYSYIAKCIYVLGLVTKKDITENDRKLIAIYIKEDTTKDKRILEFLQKIRDSIEQMPTSWKELNKQLSNSFFLYLENIKYLAPSKESSPLNINIEDTSRLEFKAQEIYHQFIQIRDDYAHSNTSSILDICVSQNTDPKFKDWTFSDYKAFLKWFLEKISEML